MDQTRKAKLAEALGWFEAMLRQYTWAAANHFTIADLALAVTVSQIEAFEFDLHPYPKVRAWLAKCKEELEPHGYQVGAKLREFRFNFNDYFLLFRKSTKLERKH